MLEQVKTRLQVLGYSTITANDNVLLTFSVDKVSNFIKNDCNVSKIPDGLLNYAIDMVIADFLKAKKAFYPDELSNFDLSGAVKQIQAGDTNVVFADGAADGNALLDTIIDYFWKAGLEQLSCFRKLRW